MPNCRSFLIIASTSAINFIQLHCRQATQTLNQGRYVVNLLPFRVHTQLGRNSKRVCRFINIEPSNRRCTRLSTLSSSPETVSNVLPLSWNLDPFFQILISHRRDTTFIFINLIKTCRCDHSCPTDGCRTESHSWLSIKLMYTVCRWPDKIVSMAQAKKLLMTKTLRAPT